MLNEEGGDGRGSWLPSFPYRSGACFGRAGVARSERVVGGKRPVLAETPYMSCAEVGIGLGGMLEMRC